MSGLKALLLATPVVGGMLAAMELIKYISLNMGQTDKDIVCSVIQTASLFGLCVVGYTILIHIAMEFIAKKVKDGKDNTDKN